MSIFGAIVDKIFHHKAEASPAAPQSQSQSQSPSVPGASASPASAAPGAGAAAQPQSAAPGGGSVDVGAVLADMAARKGGGGNYQQSIVDLLKLLDLDSSLEARKSLAQELGVHAGEPGTAEQNIALHKAVVAKLAENGGHVPDSMKH
jgi:hypothetical protein